MNPKTSLSIRWWIQFWIIVPLVASILCIALVEVGGQIAGPNAHGFFASIAFGAGLAALIVPVVAAHMVMMAAIVGVVGMTFGMRPNWKFLSLVLLGLIVGSIVLSKVYF